jgi:hypothetical protein
MSGFRPIRQVGVATSIGAPLIGVGFLLAVFAWSEGSTLLWVLAGGLLAIGLIAAASKRLV